MADALGWQVADVILSVNGYEVAGLADFVDGYQMLSGRTTFELELLRKEGRVVLSYRVE